MFSNEERMIYAKRQLVEVICQLRFPEILSIDASEPAAFQERIRREYPAGTRVELVRMDDVQAPPAGTKGTVKGVDDTGSLLMRWDNGSGLNVVYGEDIVRKVGDRRAK